ncbi:MAG: hypothetical protein JWN75_781 [Candidatus Saccharibacteria bacterium]|nr:hypothetical protein [Candidatus Saccharibacteria bacterium]
MKPHANSRTSVWIYILLWLFFVYLFFQIIGFYQGNVSNVLLGGLYFIQFGVHETAHIVFGFLPPVLVAAAGSVSEVLFTGLVAFAAFRAKSYFAGVFGLLWVMLAMKSMGNYMADARAMAMPLIGPSSDPHHDWNFVFGQLGLLNSDIFIGTTVQVIGAIIGVIGLMIGLMIIISKLMEPPKTVTAADVRSGPDPRKFYK